MTSNKNKRKGDSGTSKVNGEEHERGRKKKRKGARGTKPHLHKKAKGGHSEKKKTTKSDLNR